MPLCERYLPERRAAARGRPGRACGRLPRFSRAIDADRCRLMAKLSTSDSTHPGADAEDFGASQRTLTIPQLPGTAWVEERTRVAVARGVNVSGRLVFQEPVRIEGNFHGEVSSSELVVISDHGAVEGRVRSPRLLVLGELRGDITESRLVVLGPRARVIGRIETDSLRGCGGALMRGCARVPCGDGASR